MSSNVKRVKKGTIESHAAIPVQSLALVVDDHLEVLCGDFVRAREAAQKHVRLARGTARLPLLDDTCARIQPLATLHKNELVIYSAHDCYIFVVFVESEEREKRKGQTKEGEAYHGAKHARPMVHEVADGHTGVQQRHGL